MCPIPSCKRYSPHAGTSQVVDPQTHQAFVPIPGTSAGTATTTLRGEVLSSGVTYYPPTPIAPPAYSAEPPVTETGSPLLDVTVDKVVALVLRELDTADEEDEREREREDRGDCEGHGGSRSVEEYGPSAQIGGDTDEEGDDEDDQLPHTSLSQDLSLLGSGSIAGLRSQRRRNVFRQGPQGRYPHRAHRPIAPVALPFEKELMGLLECDVCSMLLYEPVTTPCQHVRGVQLVAYTPGCQAEMIPSPLRLRHLLMTLVVLFEMPQPVAGPLAAVPDLPAGSAEFRFLPGARGEQGALDDQCVFIPTPCVPTYAPSLHPSQ
jgi:hypothetical protein